MAKARAIVKRRKAVQNIRKITRTMELIATARFKKALDRATEAEAYTRKIAELVADLGRDGAGGLAPAARKRASRSRRSLLLVLTSNRGLAGGYNGNVLRVGHAARCRTTQTEGIGTLLEVAGKRGINYFRFRGIPADATYTQFEDRPQFDEVEALADTYIGAVRPGRDRPARRRLHAVRQRRRGRRRVVQTLLPMTAAEVGEAGPSVRQAKPAGRRGGRARRKASASPTSSCPTRRSILEEIVPGLVQGPAVQVLPRRRRQRADRPDGRHEGGDRERRRHDQDADPAVQPRPPGADHPRAGRDHRRGRGPGMNDRLTTKA